MAERQSDREIERSLKMRRLPLTLGTRGFDREGATRLQAEVPLPSQIQWQTSNWR